jgi:hypothetical protein
MSNLIICSGDSFTAGDELAGNLLVPGYTSFLYPNLQPATEERTAIYKKLQTETSKFWYDFVQRSAYEDECKKRSWPAYLEKRLENTKVINCAYGGISNEEIVHRAISTFFKFKDDFETKNISVIIMATTYNRIGSPMYDKKFSNEYDYQSYTTFHYEEKVKPSYMHNVVHNFFFDIKDYDRLVRSIAALSFAKLFFESNGIKITFVDSCLWDEGVKKFDYEYKEKVLFFNKIIPIEAKMADLKVSKILPGYHFPEDIHRDFAEHISKLI